MTSISPPVCWCGRRCWTLITPTTRFRAITGADRKASKLSSGNSPNVLKRWILIRLARDRQQPPLPGHPARQALRRSHPHFADGRRMRRVRSAQHQFVVGQKIYQAGIALREFHHQRYHALQHLGQAHVAHHESADLLEEAQLLLGAFETRFQLSGFRHDLIIVGPRSRTEPPFGATGLNSPEPAADGSVPRRARSPQPARFPLEPPRQGILPTPAAPPAALPFSAGRCFPGCPSQFDYQRYRRYPSAASWNCPRPRDWNRLQSVERTIAG